MAYSPSCLLSNLHVSPVYGCLCPSLQHLRHGVRLVPSRMAPQYPPIQSLVATLQGTMPRMAQSWYTWLSIGDIKASPFLPFVQNGFPSFTVRPICPILRCSRCPLVVSFILLSSSKTLCRRPAAPAAPRACKPRFGKPLRPALRLKRMLVGVPPGFYRNAWQTL